MVIISLYIYIYIYIKSLCHTPKTNTGLYLNKIGGGERISEREEVSTAICLGDTDLNVQCMWKVTINLFHQ